MRLLSHMLHAGDFIYQIGTSSEQAIGFRHDRVRDWLLIDAAAALLRANKLKDEIVGEPYFAEIIAGVLVQNAVPEEFVDRVLATNPLALFHALRLFQEPTTGIHERILRAINQWLDDHRSADLQHAALQREALAALAETESSKAIDIVRRFAVQDWSALQARFRNGDVLGGVELCSIMPPGSGSPWRDDQIEHAKLKFGSRLLRTLDRILRHNDLSTNFRSGALRLAGHLADPELREAINACWTLDSGRHERLDDYLWAFAECCGDDPELYLSPICDAWAALPSKSEDYAMPSPRDELAANHVRWAFRKWKPTAAIPYFVKRGENEDLRWPITFMLHEIDHPLAVDFTVQQMALIRRRLEGSGGFSLFVNTVPSNWRRHQEEGIGMSALSRQLLLNYWVDVSTDKYLRKAAFRLWAATEGDRDLDILRSSGLPEDLSDSILRARLERHDQSAIPQLLSKLQTEDRVSWWFTAKDVWSNDLLSALDAELAQRGTSVTRAWSAKFPTDFDFVATDLIMRLPGETGEALLQRHWDHLRFSSLFVQAALYLATPTLLSLAYASLEECPNPAELLKYLGQHFGIRTKGHPGITRAAQIEGLVPYLSFLQPHEVKTLWDLCNEHGWYDLRQKHLDPLLQKNSQVEYLDDTLAMESLDSMVKNRFLSVNHWLKEYAETGASTDVITAVLAKWLASRKTIEALHLVSIALSLIGHRDDLVILDVKIEPEDASADMLRADTAFAVKRRTLS
jgi:hypothetical protein